MGRVIGSLVVACAMAAPALACSLCSNLQAPTLREESAQASARLIVAGTLENPRLGAGGSGTTDLRISAVLRNHDWLAARKTVELPRYLAVSDTKNPPRFLVFCDIFKDKIDPYRGIPVKSEESVEYLKKAMQLDAKNKAENLQFYFRYLENADVEVARDAFLEFAKAADGDIAKVAKQLEPERIRTWLQDPKTPVERLSVYALLLGACGAPADADLFASMLQQGSERSLAAYDGLLAGYIHLRPDEGWKLALTTLADAKKSLPIRLAVIRTVRFYRGAQPADSKPHVLQAMMTLLRQGDLADIAIEDLRRWQMWDLTPTVLGLYGKKGFDAPILRRTIVRYALSCKDREEAAKFIADRRKADGELVKEVEESLEYEKPK